MLKHLALLAGMFALVGCYADSVEEETEDQELTSDSIIGGQVDNGNPAVGIIAYDQVEKGKLVGYNCTGTLIAPTVVLTAAHCVLPGPTATKALNWKLYFGTEIRNAKAGELIPASKAYAHADYKPGTFGGGHDAAILVLDRAPVGITPLAVNKGNITAASKGKNVIAVGAGLSDGVARTGVGTKRVATLPITDVRVEELSAGVKGRTTCGGDSGGPWIAKIGGVDTIVGLTSYGPGDCSGASSATRVDKVMDLVGPFLTNAKNPPAPPNGNPPPEQKPVPAGDLAVGQTITGSVGPDVDTFTITTAKLSLQLASTNAQIIVQNSGGGRSISSGNAQINMSTGQAVTYTIQIKSQTGNATAYKLSRN